MLDERPDGATGDDATKQRLAFADQAEALLRLILSTLGYGQDVSLADLITGIGSWIGLIKVMQRDQGGQIAGLWWRAYDGALTRCPLAHDESRRKWAEEEADYATQAFIRRFPPLLEDAPPRDTVDAASALRAALDEQTEATSRAIAEADEAHADYVQMVSEAALATARLAVANQQLKEAEANAAKLESAANAAKARADKAEHELAELRKSAIVPLSKPDRVEPGQRWAFVMTACESGDLNGGAIKFADPYNHNFEAGNRDRMLGYYLGNAPISEGT